MVIASYLRWTHNFSISLNTLYVIELNALLHKNATAVAPISEYTPKKLEE